MIDICMALDQSVSPHTGVRTIQNTGVFWQAVFQPPHPYSLFLEHGSAIQYRQLRRLTASQHSIEGMAEEKLYFPLFMSVKR